MPRSKSTTPKRLALSNEEDGPKVSGKKRRSSSFWRRKIISSDDINLPFFTISLPWNISEGSRIPSAIEIVEDGHDNFIVTVDNEILQVSQDTAQTIRQNMSNILFIYINSTKTQLELGLALKNLPTLKAQPLVELIFSKDYSDFNDCAITAEQTNYSIFKDLEALQRLRPILNKNMQLKELKPQLRDYQAAAVDWMLERESSPGTLSLRWLSEVADEFSSSNGYCLLYNKYAKALYSQIEAVPLSSGGILADEMGLGKTVITLALLLHNRRNNNDNNWEMAPTRLEEDSSSDDSSESESNERNDRLLNQESCLDANEQLQLVPCHGKKGVLRSKLQEWYESQLSGFRATPLKNVKQGKSKFKCTCGDQKGKYKKVVTCNSCKRLQHERCCGYCSNYLYLCPSCWKNQPIVPSKATLIIVPPAIFMQWNNEVQLHAPSLKTFLYSGIKDRFVQPLSMADNDVVITTYNVLRIETLYTSDAGGSRSLRNEGRFLRSVSPLERISWWRIVCDEAQMVESDLSLVRKMTDRLQAVHRWCVTGTPIQRSVADFYFLTSFTGLGVFDEKDVWMDFLMKPYMAQCKLPLLSVLSQVFWRSTKDVVEASLPEQTFELHYLNFSAIEEVFYMQQHSQSAGNFYRGLIKAGVDISLTLDRVDKRLLKSLLQPLLNVRQACTHPQVVDGISINSSSGAANLGELAGYLCRKGKQECEEALRLHIAALNGLAGLHRFSDVNEALKNYRIVLLTADGCRGEVQVDVLQRIHALNGAAEILKENSNLDKTLKHDRLKLDAEELEKKYLSKSEEIFDIKLQQTIKYTEYVKSVRNSFESSPSAWWTPVIFSLSAFEKELIDKLNEELHSNDPNEKTAAKKFLKKITSLHDVEITVNNWWNSLEDCYKDAKFHFDTLIATPRKILLKKAVECHLRFNNEREQCEICIVERRLQNLECELFATSRKLIEIREKGIDGAETKGSWKPHNVERTLSIVLSLGRTKVDIEPWCLSDGTRHGKLLEGMKREFKQLRAVWTAFHHCILAEDELNMAKQRIELCLEEEKTPKRLTVPKGERLLHVSQYQIPQMLIEFENERDSALSDFNKKKGRMMYLQNLAKDRNATLDPCPVCKYELALQWCVLYCGHCLCLNCLKQLLLQNARRVRCPVCREYTDDTDVGFVDITGNAEKSNDVIGDYSTKVDNIVRQALKLLKVDPEVKILIFSSWTEVLKILSKALLANNISFVSLPSNKHQDVLQNFLDKSKGVSVLLLPYAWGSKGLNLIEATHVFLVEPILNPAEELQAIGRVHRIGQTKQTFVHRFIVRRTIEDKIFGAVSEARDKWSSNTVTLGDLLKLFSTRNE